MSSLTLAAVPVDRILPLRQRVLIVNTNRTCPDFEGDREESTFHYGVFLDRALVGCVSLMKSSWEGEPAYQLRGMAIEPEYQGQGIGRRLLHHAEQELSRHGVTLLWCNARDTAIPFYEKNGWLVISEPFEIVGVAVHVKMIKRLDEALRRKDER